MNKGLKQNRKNNLNRGRKTERERERFCNFFCVCVWCVYLKSKSRRETEKRERRQQEYKKIVLEQEINAKKESGKGEEREKGVKINTYVGSYNF